MALEDKYYTVRAAAERLGLSEWTVRDLVRQRRLKADRLGWALLVRRDSVEEFRQNLRGA